MGSNVCSLLSADYYRTISEIDAVTRIVMKNSKINKIN